MLKMKSKEHTFVVPCTEDTTIRVYDNGGKTFDRYTAVFSGKVWDEQFKRTPDKVKAKFKMMLGFSSNPTHPQGYSQWSEGQEGRHLGRPVKFEDLPEPLQHHVLLRAKE
jgi:hypothetical protein